MKVKFTYRIEVIDGPDAGLIIDNQNRILDLFQPHIGDVIEPYRIQFKFMTPELLQKGMATLENGDTIYKGKIL